MVDMGGKNKKHGPESVDNSLAGVMGVVRTARDRRLNVVHPYPDIVARFGGDEAGGLFSVSGNRKLAAALIATRISNSVDDLDDPVVPSSDLQFGWTDVLVAGQPVMDNAEFSYYRERSSKAVYISKALRRINNTYRSSYCTGYESGKTTMFDGYMYRVISGRTTVITPAVTPRTHQSDSVSHAVYKPVGDIGQSNRSPLIAEVVRYQDRLYAGVEFCVPGSDMVAKDTAWISLHGKHNNGINDAIHRVNSLRGVSQGDLPNSVTLRDYAECIIGA
jgi:hypothetical protein